MTGVSNFPPNTPFTDFFHCPRCGAKSLSLHGERAIRCAGCGFRFYFNCASATAAFVLHQGKLILGIRGNAPQKGLLDLPGGFIEYDETAEEALIREIREELNISVTDPVYLTSAPNDYLYAGVLYKTTDIYYVCKTDDISGIEARDDVADYLLIAPEDLDPQGLAFQSSRAAFRRLLEYLRVNG